MSEAIKPTPGPWEIVQAEAGIVVRTESPSKTRYEASRYAAIGGFEREDPKQLAEAMANARLIAEAGTVFHETGLSPRQLAERNAELVDLLNGVLLMGRGTSGRIIVEWWQEEVLRTAIAKCQPKPQEAKS